MARGVFGFVFCLMTILAIGLYTEGSIISGVVTFILASALFVYAWLQSIEISNGELAYYRPFQQTAKVSLNQVTEVRLVYTRQGSMHHRYQLFNGDTLLCAFNPKFFAFKDVALIFDQIRVYSPGIVIPDGTEDDSDSSK